VESPQNQSIDPPLPPLPLLGLRPVRRSKIPWNLVAAAFGVALALRLLGPEWMRVLDLGGAHTLGELALLFAALNLAIVAHEAGHLALAWALNFDILGGSLGPVRAIRMHNTWSFQFRWSLFSGSVIVVPRGGESYWRTRMLAMVAAGPAATLLAGVISALLLLNFGTSDSALARFLGASLELNFFLFFLGLFPNARESRLQNDARLILSFLKNTAESHELLLYHLMIQFEIAGVRPGDYPDQIIRRIAKAQGRPDMCLTYANTIVLWAVDRGDLETADAWERRVMDLSEFCDLKTQNHMLAGSACFDWIIRDDRKSAKDKLAQVQIDLLSPRWFRHRVTAVGWLAAGNVPEALAEIARARYEFPSRLPYYDFERTLLTRLHRKAIATQP
jgi:hypothetical protein